MVRLWQDNYMEELNDCFPSTDWDVFQQDDDMVEAFTGYIHLCADTVCQKYSLLSNYIQTTTSTTPELKQCIRISFPKEWEVELKAV